MDTAPCPRRAGLASCGAGDRVAALDWGHITAALDADGHVRVRALLAPEEWPSTRTMRFSAAVW